MKDRQKLKETLKEKADLLSGEHRMLFGDRFQHYITETVKTRQNSEELFKSMSKGQSQPFSQGPPPQKNNSVERRISFSRRPGQIVELHQPAFPDKTLQVKLFQKKELFSNMHPELIPQGKIHSVVEGLFSQETLPRVKLADRSKHFLKNWKKLTNRNCTELQNPISHGSNPGQGFLQ